MQELEKFKLALSKARSAVYSWDTQTGEITWSGRLEDVFPTGTLPNLSTTKSFTDSILPEDRQKFTTSLETSIRAGGDYRRLYRIKTQDGHLTTIRDRGTVRREDGHTICIGTITSNERPEIVKTQPLSHISQQRQYFMHAQYESLLFRARTAEAFDNAKLHHRNSVLMKISIDNLSMLMTWYTPDFADRIMDALKIHLSSILREGDTICRIAIDQFGIILNNHSQTEAELVIDRILRRIQLYSNPSFEEPIHLRCSIGTVHFPIHAENAEDALNKAYLALSSAKSKAAEFYVDYQDAKKEHLDSREEVGQLNYLQSAFRQGKIHMAYQPLVDTRTGGIYSYECLLRMEDEDGAIRSAGNLIPVAEKMGVIDVIDGYVLERIIEELANHPDATLGFNISNMTTDDPKWLKTCTQLLQDPNIASRLIVEITETAAQHDMRQTAYFVAALQSLGVKVALDDFGAGYTSFRQLKSLSVDIVKIDGAYVRGIAENSENLIFIKALLDFNHSYGVETVAECVETGEEAKLLMNLGVDYLQGYYFGHPSTIRPWEQDDQSKQVNQNRIEKVIT